MAWLLCGVQRPSLHSLLMYRNAESAFEQIDENVIYVARTLGISESEGISGNNVCRWQSPGIHNRGVTTGSFARAIGWSTAPHHCLPRNIAGKIIGPISHADSNGHPKCGGDNATAGFLVHSNA